MQHDIVLKELIFDLLTPRVGEGGVCGQNIDYHVAAYVILFHNLICKMTLGGGSGVRSFDFVLLTPSPGSGGVLFQKNKKQEGPKSLT